MRYLGVDYGSRKTGLALSDEAGRMGFPHAIIPTDDHLIDEVLSLIEQKKVGGVVMGDSRDSSGNENPIAHDAKAFAALIERRSGIPVAFEMEAFTTQEARRTLEGELRADQGPKDASAAALILTSFLSHTQA